MSLLVGQKISVKIDSKLRLSLSRYHTVLHILNTITLRDYNGWITSVQIGEEYSRIDFNLEVLSTELCTELETKVNAVLQEGHPINSYMMIEEEYRSRPELLRTLNVKPPVIDGHVRSDRRLISAVSVNLARTLENVRLRQRKRRSLASDWRSALLLHMSQNFNNWEALQMK